jgi:hypothetical protein
LSSEAPTPSKISNEEASDNYLAKPSSECCLKGTIHKGESRDAWETITGVETYITTPSPNKSNGHILLYFPDVWGIFTNGLLVMDAFADVGFTVLGLDYFRDVSNSLRITLEHFFLHMTILMSASIAKAA